MENTFKKGDYVEVALGNDLHDCDGISLFFYIDIESMDEHQLLEVIEEEQPLHIEKVKEEEKTQTMKEQAKLISSFI